ncbi:5-formyltetrahydrofolate cyclo-ligase [Oceanicaulis sp. UBA2681]|uniref:5-formyltetrahydrofolate cyclo-ligase n=1 Tax=Oceanicaulis sp. UBA2681 TaxID=1947007 RepID=UPI00257EE02C|nr:5-formyltetrahydrofolate cyclo-ligase [Oceanicaulis sp. UBA2681]|tara:strand:- start:550 stop:1125 length:576 start_codon:yes stop_codon:yes gene_type:complete
MLTAWRKTNARRAARAARAAAYAKEPDAGRRLVEHFPDSLWPKVRQVVAGYAAIGDEIDPQTLLETFALEQARIALPCVVGKDQPLTFRSWTLDQPLEPGPFGTRQPGADHAELNPSLILVPLVGFDLKGRRLGYGGGFYDRTLEKLKQSGPLTVVGLAYAAQKLAKIPAEAHDIRLDWVVTEQGAHQIAP